MMQVKTHKSTLIMLKTLPAKFSSIYVKSCKYLVTCVGYIPCIVKKGN